MKKAERIRRLKEKLRNEDIENAKQGADSAGLGFVDHDIPPDEVDEKVVRRSLWTSLRSFIPYTNEWYEAMAAEEEMDNLKKIRIERVKANDLLTMSKMGRHEDALDTMMAETNYDFFYFNKLKSKMEAEGKFKFEPPTKMNIFADYEKSQNRNRLKKAINQVNTFMDEKTTQELTRLANLDDKISKKYSDNEPCVWRGKNKAGENLKCENARMRKPPKKSNNNDDSNGDAVSRMSKNAAPEFYQFCCYHVPFCCSGNHESGENVKIKLPNSEGFCAECFMLKLKRSPPQMSADICPGVTPVVLLGGTKTKLVKSAIADEEEEEGEDNQANPQKKSKNTKKANPLQCQWVPNPNNEQLRVYECYNERAIDPASNARLPNCPWHVPKCILAHPIGTNSVITIPNAYGLCAMHYLAEYGVHPPVTEIPYPGMKQRQARDFWKSRNRHFAVPSAPPPSDILVHDYNPRPPAEDIFDYFNRSYRYAVYLRRYYLFKDLAAKKIQATYRMYRVRGIHLQRRDAKMRRLRGEAAIVIQAQMRRFLETKYMKMRRKLYNDSCRQIQRVFRGWLCRANLRIEWAAKRIQKFMKLLHFFKFRDTVIMVMQMRRMFLHRNNAATFIQRIYRGYESRVFVFRKRYYNLLSRRSIKRIQRWYRYHAWRRKQKPWSPPSEAWVLQQCAKKLSRMILELYRDSQRRKQLLAIMTKKAPEVQRMIRGFLATSGTKKLRYLRKALRSWMKPYYAVDFMNEFLKTRVLDHYLALRQGDAHTSTTVVVDTNRCFLRKFLPVEKQSQWEIDPKTFDILLDAYYQSIHLPLLQSEKAAICKRFKNSVSGTMKLRLFDEYIYHHRQPCRKHGRRICGDCYYYKNCNVANCKCQEYQKNVSHRNGICHHCNHPKNLHSIAPLQLRLTIAYTGEKKMPLLELLAFQAEADLSVPVNVEGVPLETVLIPPIQPDDIRSEQGKRIETMKRTLLLEQRQQQEEDIVTGLATCLVEGDTIADNNKYWQQYSTSAVEPHKTYHPSAKHSLTDDTTHSAVTVMDIKHTVYEKVQFDPHPPNYQDISYQDFWSIVPQNPNKTISDYHDGFNHNIPVPIISHGELVYSFEGPQIYYNVINQLIAMEEIIDDDHPIFLKFVMDHIQIFERHWRKMCADLRTGKLDSKLPISTESRLIFESANIPRPQLAKRLDEVFRKLGFHKKVLGKDITIRPFAQKKETALSSSDRQSPLRRKRSLPFVPTEESILSMSRVPTRQSTANYQQSSYHYGLGDTSMTSPSLKPFSAEGKPLQLLDSTNLSSSLPSPMRPKTSTLTTSPDKTNTNRRDLLQALGETFKERKPLLQALEANPSRPLTSLDRAIEQFTSSPPKRRKSQSDSQRPATQQELKKANYSILTEPRDKTAYRDVMKLNNDRYVCPFPACGTTFLSKDAAIRHMITHEQKTRLATSTPQSDAHLRFYWPRDVPWLTEKKFTEKKLPPGSMRCTFPGCPEIFASKLKLDAHLRLVHSELHPSAIKHGYVTFDKQLKAIPPDRAIEGFGLEYCSYHAIPTGKCAKCMEIENNDGPKPPYQIYDRCALDLKAKEEAMLMISGVIPKSHNQTKKAQSVFELEHNDRTYGLILAVEKHNSSSTAQVEEVRGRAIFLVIDRNRVAWIGVERLYTMNELILNRLITGQIPHVSKYELFPERLVNEWKSDGFQGLARSSPLPIANDLVRWYPIHFVQRIFPIQYIDPTLDSPMPAGSPRHYNALRGSEEVKSSVVGVGSYYLKEIRI